MGKSRRITILKVGRGYVKLDNPTTEINIYTSRGEKAEILYARQDKLNRTYLKIKE